MIAIADKALELLKQEKEPEVKICSSSAYWIPLQWLYVRMIENKDLVPLAKLTDTEKQRLWLQVNELRPDKKEVWVKVMMAQALYVFDAMKTEP